MEKAKVIGIAPTLVVPDVVRTAEYYRDVLGFSIIGYFADPPEYAMVGRDGFQVHFGKSPDGMTQSNETLRKDLLDFIIWVPEIEVFYNEVKANGANIFQEITWRSYGREFLIRDCDGHRIMVGD